MSLDSTVGGANSNSYLNVSEGDAYFANRLYADSWLDASTTEKEQALITATLRVDQEEFDGTRVSQAQALKWPRYRAYADGFVIDSASIPRPLKDAVSELALELLTTNALEQSGLANFKSLSVGPVDIEVNQPVRSGSLPAQVVRLLNQLGLSGMGHAEVVRA